MTGWLARLRQQVRDLRWWLAAADAWRRGDIERRARLGSLLAVILGLRVIRARIQKLRKGLRIAATLQHGGVEELLGQHILGRLIGIRLYRRVRRWTMNRWSRWAAGRRPAL